MEEIETACVCNGFTVTGSYASMSSPVESFELLIEVDLNVYKAKI